MNEVRSLAAFSGCFRCVLICRSKKAKHAPYKGERTWVCHTSAPVCTMRLEPEPGSENIGLGYVIFLNTRLI